MAAPLSYVYSFVDGTSLVLQYDKLLHTTDLPDASSFIVNVGGSVVPVTNVSVLGREVSLTLQSPATPGSVVTVAYNDPSGGDDTNAVQDAAGNDANSLAATSVDNPTIDILSDATTPFPLMYQSYMGQVFTATGTNLDSATVSIQLPLLPVATSFRVLLVDLNESSGQYNPESVLAESEALSADMAIIGPQNFNVSFDYSGLSIGEKYAIIFDGVAESTMLGNLLYTSPNTYNDGFLIRYTRSGQNPIRYLILRKKDDSKELWKPWRVVCGRFSGWMMMPGRRLSHTFHRTSLALDGWTTAGSSVASSTY